MIAGRGPDILYSEYYYDNIFAPMKNQGILADLWPFIDADPEINREDFFQNILKAMQSPDGSLQIIANQFTVETLISMPETFDQPESFTTSKYLEIMRSALDTGASYPMGYYTGSDFLLHTLVFVDLGIIDLGVGVSRFESQVFYDLLEIASLLPREVVIEPDFSLYGRMTTGEQVFTITGIFSPTNFARYETILGDFTVLGYPSDEGGIHAASMMSNIGLNAKSKNLDAAWSFIRKYLRPDSQVVALPIRVDLFDDHVVDARSLSVWYTRDGGIEIPIYPLTAEGAIELRELVESISFVSQINLTITNIVMEEVPPFLSGNKTAEEVARIIQNRVQIYLHERT